MEGNIYVIILTIIHSRSHNKTPKLTPAQHSKLYAWETLLQLVVAAAPIARQAVASLLLAPLLVVSSASLVITSLAIVCATTTVAGTRASATALTHHLALLILPVTPAHKGSSSGPCEDWQLYQHTISLPGQPWARTLTLNTFQAQVCMPGLGYVLCCNPTFSVPVKF
jgi:hypothetical protein